MRIIEKSLYRRELGQMDPLIATMMGALIIFHITGGMFLDYPMA
jgi:hypothetical protein